MTSNIFQSGDNSLDTYNSIWVSPLIYILVKLEF